MQVASRIVQRVAVNVVDDLSRLGVRNLSVLPLAPRALATVSQTFGLKVRCVRAVCLFNGRQARADRLQRRGGWRHHLVAAPLVFAGRQAIDFLAVREQGVTVAVPHLVVPNTELARRHRPVAVQAMAPDLFAAPSVFRAPVLLHALVVHEAKAVSCVLSTATFDGAKNHVRDLQRNCLDSIRYKALGNSWAVPCARWIGERIEAVEALSRTEQREAA